MTALYIKLLNMVQIKYVPVKKILTTTTTTTNILCKCIVPAGSTYFNYHSSDVGEKDAVCRRNILKS